MESQPVKDTVASLPPERFNTLLAARASRHAAEALNRAAGCVETGDLTSAGNLIEEAARGIAMTRAALAKIQEVTSDGQ
jgi:hypothetical protein